MTANIKDLRQRRLVIKNQISQILAGAGETLTADQKAKIDELHAARARNEEAITAWEEEMERERQATPVVKYRQDVNGHFYKVDLSQEFKGPATGRTFSAMFGTIRGSAFRDGNEFLAAVSSGRFDERLIQASVQQEGNDALGGYAVP